MLDGEYVTPLSAGAELLLLLLAALFTGGAAFRLGAGWGAAATVGVIGATFVIAWWAWAGVLYLPGVEVMTFDARFLWVPVTTPIISALFSYVGSVAYVSIVEGKEKRFIKNAFGKFLSPDVVEEISADPAALRLGGQKRPLSLLFSDLSGFTTLSEELDPESLIALLNEYLDAMTRIVLEEGGYLDKYIGDAIMAFWNAPKDVEDHAFRALKTAVVMQRTMDELNARWLSADPATKPLKVRIGVHTGEVVVGNVGGRDHFDYSAIGDAVNLAARLEPANKTYDTLNMASQTSLEAAGSDKFRTRELDLIAVVGKAEPIRVFELLEMAGVELPEAKEEALRRYDAGMKAYKIRDWETAREHFMSALEVCPDDGPSVLYTKRCERHVDDPPPSDWDFVVRRTSK
jgi:adenylate cyclase